MPDQRITLWRSKGRAGRPKGNLQASWREKGKRVTWNTGTLDEENARRLAARELSRRQSASLPANQNETPTAPVEPAGTTWTPSAPTPTPAPAPAAPPVRKSLSEALTRALSSNPAGPTPGATNSVAPEVAAELEEKQLKARKLHEVFAKAMCYLTEGGLKRACRFAGREPEEMDEDEIELVREGWAEKGQDWFGRTDVGPWGKIALGTTIAGVGMYMGGKPLPPKPTPLQLVSGPRPGAEKKPDGGGGG